MQIPDFFHAAEKLGSYATLQYADSAERDKWMEVQQQRLSNNEAHKIIAELQISNTNNKEVEKARTDVIRYYENNLGRMQYRTYRKKDT